jgi:hypothetical protein
MEIVSNLPTSLLSRATQAPPNPSLVLSLPMYLPPGVGPAGMTSDSHPLHSLLLVVHISYCTTLWSATSRDLAPKTCVFFLVLRVRVVAGFLSRDQSLHVSFPVC